MLDVNTTARMEMKALHRQEAIWLVQEQASVAACSGGASLPANAE